MKTTYLMYAQTALSHFDANASVLVRIRHIPDKPDRSMLIEITDQFDLAFIRRLLVDADVDNLEVIADIDEDGMLVIG